MSQFPFFHKFRHSFIHIISIRCFGDKIGDRIGTIQDTNQKPISRHALETDFRVVSTDQKKQLDELTEDLMAPELPGTGSEPSQPSKKKGRKSTSAKDAKAIVADLYGDD